MQYDLRTVRTAAIILLLVGLGVLLFLMAPLVWSVLQIFIIAGLLSLALDVPVHGLVRRGVPRWSAVTLVIIALLGTVAALLVFIIPVLAGQFQQFLANLPGLWEQITLRAQPLLDRFPQVERTVDTPEFLNNILRTAGSWGQVARTVFSTAIGAVTAALLILVITIYTLLNPRPLLYGVRGLFPGEWWPTLDRLASEIGIRLRGWVVGMLSLVVIVGTMDYLALWLINRLHGPDLPFVLIFALLGGLLEVVPVVGPIVAAILPALVAFAIDPLLGVFVLLAFFIVQQLENYLIVPLVFRRAVRLHPVSLIFALVVLSGLFGLFGAIIAVPVAAVLKVLYDEWYYPLMHHGECPADAPPEPGSLEEAQQQEGAAPAGGEPEAG